MLDSRWTSPPRNFVGPFLEESLVFYTRQEARIRNTLSGFAHIDGRESLAAMRDRFARMLGIAKEDSGPTQE